MSTKYCNFGVFCHAKTRKLRKFWKIGPKWPYFSRKITLKDGYVFWSLSFKTLSNSNLSTPRNITKERMRTPVQHISYGIRHYPVHTLLSRMYGTITTLIPCIWYSSASPLKWIVSAPDEAPVRMEPAHSRESLIQNTWMWKKKKKLIGDINVCIIKSKDERTTTLFIIAFL